MVPNPIDRSQQSWTSRPTLQVFLAIALAGAVGAALGGCAGSLSDRTIFGAVAGSAAGIVLGLLVLNGKVHAQVPAVACGAISVFLFVRGVGSATVGNAVLGAGIGALLGFLPRGLRLPAFGMLIPLSLISGAPYNSVSASVLEPFARGAGPILVCLLGGTAGFMLHRMLQSEPPSTVPPDKRAKGTG